MRSQQVFYLLLLLATVSLSEGRGGGGGRRGGGLFSSWRKVKKPYTSSASSSRRQNGGSSSNGGGTLSSSNKGYMPLKSATQSKTQVSGYPKQQLPAGATYHTSGSSLPAGATYHPYSYGSGSVPPGGTFYANSAAMPAGAVYYAHPPSSSFSPGNFLIGMYAGQMMSHGLFGHRQYVTHVHHDNPQQQAENQKDKVIIIDNGAASASVATGKSSVAVTAVTPQFWPTDADIPLAPFNGTTTPTEYLQPPTETIFKRIAAPTVEQNDPTNMTPEVVTTTYESTVPPAAVGSGGIICMPLMINETDASDATIVREVEKIICYPAPPLPASMPEIPQEAATAGIICVPHKVLEVDDSALTPAAEQQQDCFPAPPAQESDLSAEQISTKSPDSVIGNIPTEEELMMKTVQ